MPSSPLSKSPRVNKNIQLIRQKMKLSSFFAIFALTVIATPSMSRSIPPEEIEARLLRAGPNARRMARGLPPLPPTHIGPYRPKSPRASSTPPVISCTTQTTVCCASLEASSGSDASTVLAGLGITASTPNVGAMIGIACVVPLVILGKKMCPIATAPASCCNTFLGLVGFGCTTTTLTVG
ncbi:hypothetical protein DFH09DRAFT_301203 [Mycena vulgaris]|nr:hypothetical protein DFH09DRAFT_301203 [Mycena vulgaris]